MVGRTPTCYGFGLYELLEEEGYSAVMALAKLAGCNAHYLYQCAIFFHNKKPGAELAARLIAHEPRLSWQSLYWRQIEAARASIAWMPAQNKLPSTPSIGRR